MPRDWRNDPVALERHCKCSWVRAGGIVALPYAAGVSQIRVKEHPTCPLHSSDPKYDLPKEVR